MRKLIVVGAVSAAGLAMAIVGQGVASADTLSDVTGKYYGQAKAVLAEEGLTPIIATRVGDVATDDNCVIDRIQTSTIAEDTVYVYLNCYANVASQLRPGYSRQSQLGRAAYQAQLEAQQQAEAEQGATSEEEVTAENEGEGPR